MFAHRHLGMLLLLLVACGGSSSETPTPLEPDLDKLRRQAESQKSTTSKSERGDEWSPGIGEEDPEPLPADEPIHTWGTQPLPAPSAEEIEAPF